MGVVYEAEQESLGRHVALKVLPVAGAARPDAACERFRREARAAARLHHTNIVPVFGVGEHEGVHYYAMQFIQGQGLDAVLDELRRLRRPADGRAGRRPRRRGAAPPAPASPAALLTGRFPGRDGPGDRPDRRPARRRRTARRRHRRDVAGGRSLGASCADHSERSAASRPRRTTSGAWPGSASRWPRRWPTPTTRGSSTATSSRRTSCSTPQGTVWVTDFGLAKADGDDDLTHTGDIVGTLRYMAPERFDGRSDPRSDVYAPGPDPLRAADPPAGLRRRPTGAADPTRSCTTSPPPPRKLDPHDPARPGDDRPEGDRQGARPALRDGRGAGRRPAAVPRRPADPGPAGRPVGAGRVGPAKPAEAALAAVGSLAALAPDRAAVSLWYQGQLSTRERDIARKFLYFQHIALANTAWRDGNMGRLEQLLDTCPVEHRATGSGIISSGSAIANPSSSRATKARSSRSNTASTAASPRRAWTRRSSSGTRRPASSSGRSPATPTRSSASPSARRTRPGSPRPDGTAPCGSGTRRPDEVFAASTAASCSGTSPTALTADGSPRPARTGRSGSGISRPGARPMVRGHASAPFGVRKVVVQSRRDAARLRRWERQGQPLGRDDRPGRLRLAGPWR